MEGGVTTTAQRAFWCKRAGLVDGLNGRVCPISFV